MSIQGIQRNYRKNPHTARFLQTLHTGIGSNGRNYREEMGVTAQDEDLLDMVPTTAPAFRPTPAQVALISKLVLEINAMNSTLGEQAASYTGAMDREGAWTPENTSRWIGNLIKKSRELRAAPTSPAAPVQVADGRYAVEHQGALKFFKVTNGRKAGFIFLDVQASDEWHSIRNLTYIREVLALIAVDAKAAMVRYGHELGVCGMCGRTLTDEASRAAGLGPVCGTR